VSAQQEISQLVTEVFQAYQKANIKFLLRGNYASRPHLTTDDFLHEELLVTAKESVFGARQANGGMG
jgi:hypothetical protein